MSRAAKQIAVGAVLLLVLCVICRFFFIRTYNLYYPLYSSAAEKLASGEIRVEAETPGIVQIGVPVLDGNYLKLPLLPEQPGRTFLSILDNRGGEHGILSVSVTRFHTLLDHITGGFSGDTVAMLAATVFWFFVSAVLLWNFHQQKGPSFYHHSTVRFAGFFLFSLLTGLSLLEITLYHFISPGEYSMFYVYSALSGASSRFVLLTSPLIVAFALAMAVSNIALLRHLRPGLQNILGLLISLLMILGLALSLFLTYRDFSGSEWEWRVSYTLSNTYTTIFAYFECMLTGSVICGIKAARHIPSPDKDFIVILGCWFRENGTLPPMLRGRVDRALAFWRSQKESSGKEACFVPSGGQGPDEPMPEAEAMRRYLLSQGVPDHLILPETASGNTFENMSFSKKIIREKSPDGKIIFATTNYHVFRSGVWASLAGMPAEGIGSKTKWWFWPNAFMRETISLLLKRWKQEILLLILLLLYFGVLSMLLG